MSDHPESPRAIWKRVQADLAAANRAEKKLARLMNRKTIPGTKFLEVHKHAANASEAYRHAASTLGSLSHLFWDLSQE